MYSVSSYFKLIDKIFVACCAFAATASISVATLAHAPTEKVYLYPIVIQERAVAILYALAGGPES